MAEHEPTTPHYRKSVINRDSIMSFDETSHVLLLEKTIAVEQKRVLRDQLRECVLQNFENANEKCYDLRVQYVELLKDRHGGMLFPPGFEPRNRVNPAMLVKEK